MLDKNYWTERYKTNAIGWDIGYASPAIIEFAQEFDKDSKILIPGAGNGHESLALARLGYHNITVCDLSYIPLKNIEENDSTNTIKTVEGDFFELYEKFDLILEQTFFCALEPNLRNDYINQMYKLLKPNGFLGGLLFGIEFDKQGPPFGGNLQTYKEAFSQLFEIVKMDVCQNSIPERLGSEIFFVVKRAIQ